MLKPLNAKVLLKVSEKTTEVAGLIISQKEAVEYGKVLAVSREDIDLTVGDDVLIKTGAGHAVPEGRLVNYVDILGVCEK